METKNKEKIRVAKGVPAFKKMLEDKRAIRNHLRNGGTFEELKKKGYRFATV